MKRPKIEDKEFKPIRNGEDYYQALENYVDWREGEYKRISKELTDKVKTIHKYLKQIKALEEEVDFWKSLATELEDRQALK